MFINQGHPEGMITSEVKKLNTMINLEEKKMDLEIHTKNSIYLLTNVPYPELANLLLYINSN